MATNILAMLGGVFLGILFARFVFWCIRIWQYAQLGMAYSENEKLKQIKSTMEVKHGTGSTIAGLRQG